MFIYFTEGKKYKLFCKTARGEMNVAHYNFFIITNMIINFIYSFVYPFFSSPVVE